MRRLFRPRRPTTRRSPHAVVKKLLQPLLRFSAEKAKMADRQPLRILCFGDSLTAGYTAMGSRFHPYSKKLADMVAMAFPDLDVQTFTSGKSGDTVRHGFKYRIEDICTSLCCSCFHPKYSSGCCHAPGSGRDGIHFRPEETDRANIVNRDSLPREIQVEDGALRLDHRARRD